MHLKLPDVKEINLCSITTIIWLWLVLSDVCKKHKMMNDEFLLVQDLKSLLLQSEVCAFLTHVREELNHLVWIALLAGCENPEQTF